MSKVINISSNGIKQAIDDLVNENELLQDKVYKQNEEIERLNNDIKILLKENENKEKVILKYNNIINELEKWLKECKNMCANYTFDDTYECEYNFYQQIAIADFIKSFILNKLQELKGNNNENNK